MASTTTVATVAPGFVLEALPTTPNMTDDAFEEYAAALYAEHLQTKGVRNEDPEEVPCDQVHSPRPRQEPRARVPHRTEVAARAAAAGLDIMDELGAAGYGDLFSVAAEEDQAEPDPVEPPASQRQPSQDLTKAPTPKRSPGREKSKSAKRAASVPAKLVA